MSSPFSISKRFLAASFFLLILFGVVWTRIARHGATPSGPNILLITLDTTRADRLGCYGYDKAYTPYLDGVAAAGVLFEDAQSPVPITLPSHASILTGLLPPEHGLRINGGSTLPEAIPTLTEILKHHGYQTGAFVASPVLSAIYGLDRGFDVYDDDMPGDSKPEPGLQAVADLDRQHGPYRVGEKVADAALQWLQATQDSRAPFFGWVHFYDPHLPFNAHRELFGEHFEHPYDAEVAYMDMQIGRLFTFLDEAGLKEDTLVVVVGDHGEGLGDNGEESHCFFIYRATQHVPLIMTWKDRLPAGLRIPQTVGIVDVMSTLLDIVGLAPDIYSPRTDPRNAAVRELMQTSLEPALRGEALQPRTVYMETLWPYHLLGWAPLFGIVTEEWKYIRAPQPELYDRINDPMETTNLIDVQPRIADELAMLLEALEARSLSVADPEAVTLDADTQRRLASLGYTSGGQVHELPTDVSGMVDVKDVKELIVLQSNVRSRIGRGDTSDELIAQLNTLLEASPGTSLFHNWHGLSLTQRKQFDAAIDAFQHAIELARDPVAAHNNLAICYAEMNRMPDAIRHFEKAWLGKSHDPMLRDNLARALTRTGAIFLRAGRAEPALELFERVVELWPDQPGPFLNLGSALQQTGQRAQAEAAFRKALAIDPTFQQAHQALRALEE